MTPETFPTLPFSPMAEAIFGSGHNTCRYPIAADDEFRFCGEPVAMRLDGKPSSYCSACRRLTIFGTLNLRNGREVRS